MEQNKTGRRNRKKGTIPGILMLTILMILGGTFAWFHMVDALNSFRSEQVKSVVLHDDYDERLIDKEQSGWNEEQTELTFNKDVYVENSGQVRVFVRIRMEEYMEIYGKSLVTGAVKDDMDTWTRHMYDRDMPENPENCGEEFHGYWKWNMWGGPQEYAPAPAELRNKVADRYEGGTDHLVKGAVTNRETPDQDEWMYMADYIADLDYDEQDAYVGWLLDEADGYAYWSQMLDGGEETGLLLDSVTLTDPEMVAMYSQNPAEAAEYYDFYYGIHIIMESVDEYDVDTWVDGTDPVQPAGEEDDFPPEQASEDAEKFLKRQRRKYKELDYIKVTVQPDRTVYTYGDSFEKQGMEVTAYYINGNPEILEEDEYTVVPMELGETVHETDPIIRTQTLTVAYEGKTDTVAVEVENPLQRIAVTTPPKKVTYAYGAFFEPDGIVVTAYYASGGDRDLAEHEYTIESVQLGEPADAKDPETKIRTIKITHEDKSTTQDVQVTNTITFSLDDSGAVKEYIKGAALTAASLRTDGLRLYASYQSGEKEEVTAYTPSPSNLSIRGKNRPIAAAGTYKNIPFNLSYNVEVITRMQRDIRYGSVFGEVQDDNGKWWIILSKDKEKAGTAEILSKDCVGTVVFDTDIYNWKWSTSQMRTWLRGAYKNSLDADFKDIIVEVNKNTNLPQTAVTNTGDSGSEIVYLLSYSEYQTYSSAYNRDLKSYGISSTYAYWWLRSPSPSTRYLAYTVSRNNTNMMEMNVEIPTLGVRPAVTVEY